MEFYRVDERQGYEGCEYTTLYLVRETKKGYWISFNKLGEAFRMQLETTKEPWRSFGFIWVSKTAKKRYAYPTKEEALNSFIIRSRKYVAHLKRRIAKRELALSMAEKGDVTTFPSTFSY